MKRAGRLTRRTPLAFRSKKTAAKYVQRRVIVTELLAERPVCQRCEKRKSRDVHELLSRARGGSILDLANLVCLCRRCHTFITENPLIAEAEGWARSALRSWQRPA